MLVNVGFDNCVNVYRVVALVNLTAGSAPLRKLVQSARDNDRLVDATMGRRTRSALVMDDGTVVLSSVAADSLARKFNRPVDGEVRAVRSLGELPPAKRAHCEAAIRSAMAALSGVLGKTDEEEA